MKAELVRHIAGRRCKDRKKYSDKSFHASNLTFFDLSPYWYQWKTQINDFCIRNGTATPFRATPSASYTPAKHSKQIPQLISKAALPALCRSRPGKRPILRMECLLMDQTQKYVIKAVLNFLVHRHKADYAAQPKGCVARFEQHACVFASCGALFYGKISASLK